MSKNIFLVLGACLLLLADTCFSRDWIQKNPPSPPAARFANAAANINGNRILMFGGDKTGFDNGTWIYNHITDTWADMNPDVKPSERIYTGLASIGTDKVLLYGGRNEGGEILDDTWIYDLGDNTWTQDASGISPGPRAIHSMSHIGDDKVMLFGGIDDGFSFHNETWIYDLSEGTWTNTSPSSPPSARNFFSLAKIGDDKVLMFGGRDDSGVPNNQTWIYDLGDNTWTQDASGTSPTARWGHGLCEIGTGEVLFFGGADAGNTVQNDTWTYDISTGEWVQESATAMPSARRNFSMAKSRGRDVVLFGGFTSSRNGETWLISYAAAASVSTLDPENNGDDKRLRGEITDDGGTAVTDRGFVLYPYEASDKELGSAGITDLNEGNGSGDFPAGIYYSDVNSLSAETHYSYRAYAINTIDTSYGTRTDFWTLSPEPSSHAAIFEVDSILSGGKIRFAFSPASSIDNADGYLLIARKGAAPADLPQDGTMYEPGNTIGETHILARIDDPEAAYIIAANLSQNKEYTFMLIPYNWNGSDEETANYRTSPAIPGVTATPIPTLTGWALAGLLSLIAIGGYWILARKA